MFLGETCLTPGQSRSLLARSLTSLTLLDLKLSVVDLADIDSDLLAAAVVRLKRVRFSQLGSMRV